MEAMLGALDSVADQSFFGNVIRRLLPKIPAVFILTTIHKRLREANLVLP